MWGLGRKKKTLPHTQSHIRGPTHRVSEANQGMLSTDTLLVSTYAEFVLQQASRKKRICWYPRTDLKIGLLLYVCIFRPDDVSIAHEASRQEDGLEYITCCTIPSDPLERNDSIERVTPLPAGGIAHFSYTRKNFLSS